MKIYVVDEVELVEKNCFFAVYFFDETISRYEKYIDIRGIIHKNQNDWLDDLQKSYHSLDQFFSKKLWSWWVTPMSRLDCRPWAQEYVVKALFFAIALTRWIRENPKVEKIYLIAPDLNATVYLKEFLSDVQVIDCYAKRRLYKNFISSLKVVCLPVFSNLKQFFNLLLFNSFARPSVVSSKILVLYELVSGFSFKQGHEYYFGNLFDDLSTKIKISFGCIIGRYKEVDDKSVFLKSNRSCFLLFNFLNIGDCFYVLSIMFRVFFMVWVGGLKRHVCSIDGIISYKFWQKYLLNELKRLPFVNNIAISVALERVFSVSKVSTVVYPYEEKGGERAILHAVKNKGIKSIGYLPHPQHRLGVALSDKYNSAELLKPSMYAVCGCRYIDFLKKWGDKKQDISVWGSGKKFDLLVHKGQEEKRVLLLVSHPNELKIFFSWLMIEEKLQKGFIFLVRLYKAVKNVSLDNEMQILMRTFRNIKETNGTLNEDLENCDVAVFCATSAGIVAMKQGVLSLHVSLDDFFRINPCFDDFTEVFSSSTSKEFSDNLDKVFELNQPRLAEIMNKQKLFANSILGDKQNEVIEKDLG